MLPLRVANGERGSDLLRAQHGLIPTINHFCDEAFVRQLTIVVPSGDVREVRANLTGCAIKVEVIPENDLIPVDRIGAIPRRGWFVQQLIKLAYSRVAETSFYVTLDADVFVINPLTRSVFREGKAPAAMEPASAHAGWWEASVRTLEFDISAIAFDPEKAFGVTPAFMKTDIVAATLDRLDTIARAAHSRDWVQYLCDRTSMQNNCWTEYSLYWTHLINTANPWDIYYQYSIYLYSHYTAHVARTIMAKDQPYPHLFAIIQSSFVDDQAHAAFVAEFLASRGAAPNA